MPWTDTQQLSAPGIPEFTGGFLNIIGEFPVQNSEDAKHWVATVNFLRTVTKMFFGRDDTGLKGNPPPILHFQDTGPHVPEGTCGTELVQR